tara:strand:- start:157 stop:408 length:252 start_codon:yes stop_codon:yes gene_type:complete
MWSLPLRKVAFGPLPTCDVCEEAKANYDMPLAPSNRWAHVCKACAESFGAKSHMMRGPGTNIVDESDEAVNEWNADLGFEIYE